MTSQDEADRRKFPRAHIRVPLSLCVSADSRGEPCDATIHDVSMNGVYCTVNHFLPVFDRVLLTFVLPEEQDAHAHLVSRCEGIVVRVEPEEEQPDCAEYRMAVYFHNLSPSERNLLQTLLHSYAEAA